MVELTAHVDTRAFDRAMREVARIKNKTVKSDLFYQGRQLVRKLVFATRIHRKGERIPKFVWNEEIGKWARAIDPKTGKKIMVKTRMSGRARAGWIPSWRALGNTNVPRGTMVANKIAGKEGRFIDKSRGVFPSIELINEVPFIDDIPGQAGKIQTAINLQTKQMEAFILRKTMQRLNKQFK